MSFYQGGLWDDDGWGDTQSDSFTESYGVQSYYKSRWKGYKEKLSSWKKEPDGNVVFPEVAYSDNRIIHNKKITKLEQNRNILAKDVIPGFVGGDLYRLLYHENPQLTKPDDNSKDVWFDALSSLPIYGLAMQTNKSKFWSKLATEAMINAMMQELEDKGELTGKDDESPQQRMQRLSELMKNALNGKGEGSQSADVQSKMVQSMMDKGMKGAQDQMNKTKSFMDELGIDKSALDGQDGNMAGDGEIIHKLLDERNGLIDKFYVNPDAAVEFLRSTQNFFNTAIGKQRNFQDDFLHSDNFSEIINPELMQFPFELANINVMTSKRSTQIDLYLDISGSMNRTLSQKTEKYGIRNNSALRIIDAVAIFAYKLWRKGIVRNVYTFDYGVTELKPNQILFITPGGGTSFHNVVDHYIQERKQGSKTLAFILTDGDDDTSLYHKDAYWMFIEGGPYDDMKKNFPDTQMRIWSNGHIKKISEWRHT